VGFHDRGFPHIRCPTLLSKDYIFVKDQGSADLHIRSARANHYLPKGLLKRALSYIVIMPIDFDQVIVFFIRYHEAHYHL
jgi:hypothetical protein